VAAYRQKKFDTLKFGDEVEEYVRFLGAETESG